MEFIITFNSIMWGWVLAVILIGTGLYYSIRLGFPQLRQFKHVIGSLGVNLKSDGGGVSGFAALCTAVGAQVGTGSLVGVASALVAGGPGALFWMWVTAVFGMVISFGEATLGQLFHEKGKDGNYYGGAHYYMTKGLHNRPLAIAYAAMTLLTVGVCIAMLQNNSIAAAFTGVFDISPWIPGVLVAFLAALIVLGGVKRITDAASYIVPFMAIGYILVTIVIIALNITHVPAMIATIFRSAFSVSAATGGVVGYSIQEAIRNGMARGLFSNDAGNGAAATMHGSAKVKHPATQGFSAMFGTFTTTIVICTCSGFAILLTGALDSGLDGVNLVQASFSQLLGSFGGYFVLFATFLFCFTTLIADIFAGEVGIRYLMRDSKGNVEPVVKAYQVIVLILVAIGAAVTLPVLWNLVDFFASFMVLLNVYALFRLFKYVKCVLNDYLSRLRAGESDPVWTQPEDIESLIK